MAKNNVNLIAALLLGIPTVGTTTTVLGAEITELIPITLENIVIEKNPYLGTPGWMKKENKQTPSDPV
jgi:hypothetical protein